MDRLKPQVGRRVILEQGKVLPISEGVDRFRRCVLLEGDDSCLSLMEHGLRRILELPLESSAP